MIYRVKRFSVVYQKEFGVVDPLKNIGKGIFNGARDVTGDVVEGAGKIADSGIGKVAAGLAGIGMSGKAGLVGANLLGSVAPGIGHLVGGLGGAILAPGLASKAVSTAGKVLKNVGQDIHS